MPPDRSDQARRRTRAGRKAESLVESILVSRGWFALARNHVVRGGEVDLVMRDGPTVVFVEVKQRRRGSLVDPLESVTVAKQARVVRAAEDYLARAGLLEAPVRFDVVAVTTAAGQPPQLAHVPGAFDASSAGAR